MHVIIAGAGISGLTAAISLRRCGHRVTIYERSSLNNEVGAAINVPPNATRFLVPWGLDPTKYGFIKSNGLYFMSPKTLEVLASIPISFDKNENGQPLYLAHRVDLHTALKELAIDQSGPGIPVVIHLKNGVASYDPTTPSVTLQDGEIIVGDLVVAADGLHSVAPQVINEDTKAPEVAAPLNCCYRFLIPRAEIDADPELSWFTAAPESRGVRVWTDPAGKRRIVDYSCRNFEVHNMLALCHNEEMGTDAEDWHASVDKSEMLGLFEGFHPKLLAIIQKKAPDMKRWPLLYRTPLKKWTRDKLVLCGDSAHPMLPHQAQGGAQGMEDGFALGLVMYGVTQPAEIEQRLVIYEKIRRSRASMIQILSNRGADEVEAPEIAEFLDGRSMPTSAADIKHMCFTEDILERTIEHMTAYDPEWKVPEGFFTQQVESALSSDDKVVPDTGSRGFSERFGFKVFGQAFISAKRWFMLP